MQSSNNDPICAECDDSRETDAQCDIFAFRAREKLDHERIAQRDARARDGRQPPRDAARRRKRARARRFEYELQCECDAYARQYDALRAQLAETKHRRAYACGGGAARDEAIRLAALRPGFDPGATSLDCSPLGLPKCLAHLAEADRKRALEDALEASLGDAAARRADVEADHVASLKTAFKATDDLLQKIKGSITDKQAATADLALDLHRLHVDVDAARGTASPP